MTFSISSGSESNLQSDLLAQTFPFPNLSGYHLICS